MNLCGRHFFTLPVTAQGKGICVCDEVGDSWPNLGTLLHLMGFTKSRLTEFSDKYKIT